MIKAIIFDCDGILVDTEELKFQAWKKVLEPPGIELTHEMYRKLIGHTGLTILHMLEEAFSLSLDPKIVDEKNELYWSLQKSDLKSIESMIHVVQWAKAMRDQNILKLGVASSSSKKEILFNLDYLKIPHFFDVVLSGKEDLGNYHDPLGVNKPQPYIYLEACRKLELAPEECLVLEDSEPGVNAAKKAGCFVIAVPTQWTMEQDFHKADQVIYNQSHEEVLRCIKTHL